MCLFCTFADMAQSQAQSLPPLYMNFISEDSSHGRKILCPLSNRWCVGEDDAQIAKCQNVLVIQRDKETYDPANSKYMGKQSWPSLRNTDMFYSDIQTYIHTYIQTPFSDVSCKLEFLLKRVCKYQHMGFLKWSMIPGSCWLKLVWCSSGSVLPTSWTAAVTFMTVLILLSVCSLPWSGLLGWAARWAALWFQSF